MRETINLIITETGRTVFHQSSEQGWSFLQELFNDFSDEELPPFGSCSRRFMLLMELNKTDLKQQEDRCKKTPSILM